VFLYLPELGGKQIQLLTEAMPRLSRVGVVWDSTIGDVQFRAIDAAARAAGVTLRSLVIQRVEEVKDAFDRAAREGLHGGVILSSPLIHARRAHITSLALQMRLPTISLSTLFPPSGDAWRLARIFWICIGARRPPSTGSSRVPRWSTCP
jgi:putative ABC transport system substrate-binding protein